MARSITQSDYRILAAFRASIRDFLQFSEQRAATVGLSPKQHQVLLILRASEQALTVGEVAAALSLKPNSASELVRRLGDGGLVRLTADPADHRRRTLTLTPRAEEALAALSEAHREELRRMRPTLKALLDALE